MSLYKQQHKRQMSYSLSQEFFSCNCVCKCKKPQNYSRIFAVGQVPPSRQPNRQLVTAGKISSHIQQIALPGTIKINRRKTLEIL